MYPKFAHVLSCSGNKEILCEAVQDLGKAGGLQFSTVDTMQSVDTHIKRAIEENVVGTRYITSPQLLFAANQFVVTRALNDLKEASNRLSHETSLKAMSQNDQAKTKYSQKRREIQTDRFLEPMKNEDDLTKTNDSTPRKLLFAAKN